MLLPDLIRFGSLKVCGAIGAAHPPATVSARYGQASSRQGIGCSSPAAMK